MICITFRQLWLFRVVAMLSLVLMGAQVASGQGTPAPEVDSSSNQVAFGIFPQGTTEGIYFESFIEAGASRTFTAAIVNAGTQDLSLLAYHADVYSMTNGGMGVNFQEQERTAPTTWIDFDEGIVDVPVGQEIAKTFTVTVPDGTEPGQYVSAIAVETANSFAVGDEGGALRQILRKVVAVVILVPGESEPGFSLGSPEITIQQGQAVVRVPVENTGNIRVRPAGDVTVLDPSGAELATGEVSMGSVYRGHTAPIEIWFPNAIPEGEYLISAELTDPDTGVSAAIENVPVSVVPEATPEPDLATPVVAPMATPMPEKPVTLQSVEIEANADAIQFANVMFDIENTGNHISRARVTMEVSHNGEVVEEFVLEEHLPLPVGTTSVEDRYIPPTGWESGIWQFSIIVHSITSNDNVETVVVSEVDLATIEVP